MTIRGTVFDAVELYLYDTMYELDQQYKIMCTLYTKIDAVNCFESGNMVVIYRYYYLCLQVVSPRAVSTLVFSSS